MRAKRSAPEADQFAHTTTEGATMTDTTSTTRASNAATLKRIRATAPASDTTTLHKALAFGQQSADYQETLQMGTAKLRIMITRDSYEFQSSAHLDAFSPTDLKWNRIAFIPHGIMATNKTVSYWARATEADFRADRDNLLAQARAILA